jgi:hypothetical protein
MNTNMQDLIDQLEAVESDVFEKLSVKDSGMPKSSHKSERWERRHAIAAKHTGSTKHDHYGNKVARELSNMPLTVE